jgi:hypothetical protein
METSLLLKVNKLREPEAEKLIDSAVENYLQKRRLLQVDTALTTLAKTSSDSEDSDDSNDPNCYSESE